MLWILLALACPLLHGISNLIDNYLADRTFKDISSLVYYSSFFHIIFLPFVLFVGFPSAPQLAYLPFFFVIGLIEILYLYPYFVALKNDDTSVVISLFSLGKIIVPLLAYFFVGEVLTWQQYVGFAVLLVASSLLTVKSSSIFHWNKSFFYMFLASLLLSVEAVLYKYLFTEIGWIDGFFWTTVCSFVCIQLFFLIPTCRRNIVRQFPAFKKIVPLFALEELTTFGGTAAGTYALSLAPTTLVKSMEEVQPFFVLLYALLLKRFFPQYFREKIDMQSTLRKIALFWMMAVGVFLIVS